jgi:hypothetical protein
MVRLLEALATASVREGSLGVVVATFLQPEEAYEVEFTDDHGQTIAQVTLRPEQFAVVR